MSFLTVLILAGILYGGINLFVKLTAWWADQQTIVNNDPEDTVAPSPPRLVITNRVVKESNFSLIGFSEPESGITLTNNGQPVAKVNADSNGQFNFSDLTLVEGENALSVKASDKAGNFSQPSSTETIIFDNKPPALQLEYPTNGSDFRGADSQTIEIRGKTEEKARVWINDKLVIIGEDGQFVATHRLNQGNQELKIKSIDSAGNETEQVISVSYSP